MGDQPLPQLWEDLHFEVGPLQALALIALIILLWKIRKAYLRWAKQSQKKKRARISHIEHQKHTHLATADEQKLYHALRSILPEDHLIHCQVSLIALVEPLDYRQRSRAWSKRMDYVITDSSTRILAAIELDDPTHSLPDRKRADAYKNHALAPHHPLIRLPSQKSYSTAGLRHLIEAETSIRCL